MTSPKSPRAQDPAVEQPSLLDDDPGPEVFVTSGIGVTGRGLAGELAEKPRRAKRAPAADDAASEEKPAPKRRASKIGAGTAPKKRAPRRTSAIDAAALLRAREREEARAARPVTPEAEAEARAFDEAFPLFSDETQTDPNAPRTGPAKLPDLALIEKLEAEARTKKPRRRPAAKKLTGAGAALTAKLSGAVRTALEEAADHLLGRSSPEFALVPLNPVRVVVAISGGSDSMALLDIAAKLFHEKRQALISRLCAVYVHHGIEPDADKWQKLCAEECAKRSVEFECIHVRVALKGESIEAAAREARYRALGHFALREGFDIVMTAHHEDDRIETFLLQWMRGAGLDGLAAFPEARELAAPSAEDARAVQSGSVAFLLRPWTGIAHGDIERYVRNHRIAWVNDPDNESPRFSRSRVRAEVIPVLESIRPGFRSAAARSVALVAEALEVLKSVARTDLESCRSEEHPRGLSIFRLLELIPARQAWCLRAWLAAEGLRPISKARLEDMLRQVRETHSDATFAIRVQGKEIRRWGPDLVIREAVVRRLAPASAAVVSTARDTIAVPDWGGAIELIPCGPDESGIARERLAGRSARLEVRATNGAAKLRLWELRPARPLKDLYAQAGIPAYARADLPRLWLNGELLFAAGLGMDVRFIDDPAKFPDRVRLRWHPDLSLWDDRAVPNYAELPEEDRREREERVRAAVKALSAGRRRGE
ncbi:tRNA lysidine(34) synthetase TilS [Sutterella sp.]|uniref:tRNA lysidine(34) synthetase TilS n=1 Tax=Sutterella sp. TaxID=1981025 RepID=UPI0026E0B657|nr:tRNA lysidine(34) synthetase TilS [Sutterella sp.]MDO5530995.1 tRNA lysidine(34) synthetase TilS [Sutterella sp.]